MALAAVVGITAGYHLLRETSYRFWIPLATLTMRRIACDTFERVQRFSADWHANSFAGSTVRKISRGMWAYDLLADTFYVGFLPAAVILAGVAAILFRSEEHTSELQSIIRLSYAVFCSQTKKHKN